MLFQASHLRLSISVLNRQGWLRYECYYGRSGVREFARTRGGTEDAKLDNPADDTCFLPVVVVKRRLQPSTQSRVWIRPSKAYQFGRYKFCSC